MAWIVCITEFEQIHVCLFKYFSRHRHAVSDIMENLGFFVVYIYLSCKEFSSSWGLLLPTSPSLSSMSQFLLAFPFCFPFLAIPFYFFFLFFSVWGFFVFFLDFKVRMEARNLVSSLFNSWKSVVWGFLMHKIPLSETCHTFWSLPFRQLHTIKYGVGNDTRLEIQKWNNLPLSALHYTMKVL